MKNISKSHATLLDGVQQKQNKIWHQVMRQTI